MSITIDSFANKLVKRVRRFVDLDFDDAKDYLDEVVKEYSKYKPYLQSTTISLVADTQDYSLPTDTVDEGIVSVSSAAYLNDPNPTGADIFDRSVKQTGNYDYPYESPAVTTRTDQYDGFSNDRFGLKYEYFEIDGTKKIRLYPTPGTADTVYLEYNSYHTKGTTTYSSIDDQDEPVLFSMAYLRVIKYEALDSGQSGTEKIELEGKIGDLEKDIRQRLCRPTVGRS